MIRNISWSENFAYAIGLLASDGNLSKDGRHITFVSRDIELIKNFQNALGINKLVRQKNSGFQREKIYYFIQFSDVQLYKFLVSIGLTPRKSKTIQALHIPGSIFLIFCVGNLKEMEVYTLTGTKDGNLASCTTFASHLEVGCF